MLVMAPACTKPCCCDRWVENGISICTSPSTTSARRAPRVAIKPCAAKLAAMRCWNSFMGDGIPLLQQKELLALAAWPFEAQTHL